MECDMVAFEERYDKDYESLKEKYKEKIFSTDETDSFCMAVHMYWLELFEKYEEKFNNIRTANHLATSDLYSEYGILAGWDYYLITNEEKAIVFKLKY